MANIVLITPCYPRRINSQQDVAICHYFAREWVKQGHNVRVYVIRSVFPRIYYWLLNCFSIFRECITQGSDVYDRVIHVENYEIDNVSICSIPINKYIPHGKYPMSELRKVFSIIDSDLKKHDFLPDAIVGHWVNSTLYLLSELKKKFPIAYTSLTLHGETYITMKKVFHKGDEYLSNVDYIGYRSPRIKKNFEATCPVKKNTFYCYSGVSNIFLKPLVKSSKFNNNTLSRFVFAGRLVKYKYPKEIIEALQKVYGNEFYHLNYIGRKTDLYSKIHLYVVEKGLSDKLEFTGLIPREQMPDAFDKEECLIMISKGEVFGMVYIEAMARGCIVIAGSDSGVSDIIKSGYNGFLCQPGNVNNLVDIIRKINKMSIEEKNIISQNARKTVEQLSDQAVSENYLKIVLSGKS